MTFTSTTIPLVPWRDQRQPAQKLADPNVTPFVYELSRGKGRVLIVKKKFKAFSNGRAWQPICHLRWTRRRRHLYYFIFIVRRVDSTIC